MKKVYIASGLNPMSGKQLARAFQTEKQADAFINGLANPHVQVVAYKSTVELLNHFLGGKQ